jgi:hypothetical protein
VTPVMQLIVEVVALLLKLLLAIILKDIMTMQARQRQKQLTRVLNKYLLRRTKDGCIRDQLPAKTDNIVFCELSELQSRAYRSAQLWGKCWAWQSILSTVCRDAHEGMRKGREWEGGGAEREREKERERERETL